MGLLVGWGCLLSSSCGGDSFEGPIYLARWDIEGLCFAANSYGFRHTGAQKAGRLCAGYFLEGWNAGGCRTQLRFVQRYPNVALGQEEYNDFCL